MRYFNIRVYKKALPIIILAEPKSRNIRYFYLVICTTKRIIAIAIEMLIHASSLKSNFIIVIFSIKLQRTLEMVNDKYYNTSSQQGCNNGFMPSFSA